MQTILGKHWHQLPIDEVLLLLGSQEGGLDVFEVKHRQEHFGMNVLTPAKRKSALRRFLQQFNNPLIYILLAATLITILVKDLVDGLVILMVVMVNAVIGYLQESRAEESIHALAQTMTTEASVIRANTIRRLPAAEIVPGDIVLLAAGDRVPADMRLISTRNMYIEEAALTGESLPVNKSASPVLKVETVLAERTNMAYTSTLVTSGQGSGVVTATGDNSEIGHISRLISEAADLDTPLTRKIERFSRLLLYFILVLASITFVVGIARGDAPLDVLTSAIALAVGSIPEGLPAAITITLAIGVSRMADRKAIVRRLAAVETLGSVTVICSDKTGTLTQNQMTVQQVVVPDACYEVSGSGYDPQGVLYQQDPGTAIQPQGALLALLEAGLLCNDSQLSQQDGRWMAQGDPTEAALLVSALKGGLDIAETRQRLPRLDIIPFDSRHQYMATLHQRGEGKAPVVLMKGAVEVLLARCVSALDSNGQEIPLDADQILSHVDKMAKSGLRVLAFARKELPPDNASLQESQVEDGLVFLGLQGMIDPPRPEAISAVNACQNAGVQIKMITGDHALTAATVARQLGLYASAEESGGMHPTVITGSQLAGMSDTQIIAATEHTVVFARISPEQKLRLVESLQARGEVVAMTGDGVNDAPALKQADIGVAMGITGTDVSKEAADMVLTDDNFATLEAAVEEGRTVFDNLTKIIAWTLPTNLGQGLIILTAVLLGETLPVLPLQVLWINMTSVGALGLVLAMEKGEADIMKRKPRGSQAPILTGVLLWRILIVGVLILLGSFGLFELELYQGGTLAQARTVAVNSVVAVAVFYLFNCRSLIRSVFRIGFFSNPWVIAGVAAMILLQMLFTYAPFMNEIFSSAPIGWAEWSRILAFGLVSFTIIEVEKALQRRSKKQEGL